MEFRDPTIVPSARSYAPSRSDDQDNKASDRRDGGGLPAALHPGPVKYSGWQAQAILAISEIGGVNLPIFAGMVAKAAALAIARPLDDKAPAAVGAIGVALALPAAVEAVQAADALVEALCGRDKRGLTALVESLFLCGSLSAMGLADIISALRDDKGDVARQFIAYAGAQRLGQAITDLLLSRTLPRLPAEALRAAQSKGGAAVGARSYWNEHGGKVTLGLVCVVLGALEIASWYGPGNKAMAAVQGWLGADGPPPMVGESSFADDLGFGVGVAAGVFTVESICTVGYRVLRAASDIWQDLETVIPESKQPAARTGPDAPVREGRAGKCAQMTEWILSFLPASIGSRPDPAEDGLRARRDQARTSNAIVHASISAITTTLAHAPDKGIYPAAMLAATRYAKACLAAAAERPGEEERGGGDEEGGDEIDTEGPAAQPHTHTSAVQPVALEPVAAGASPRGDESEGVPVLVAQGVPGQIPDSDESEPDNGPLADLGEP